MGSGAGGDPSRRDLSEVTCFRCYEKGHYANRCPNAGRTVHQSNEGQLDLGRQQEALHAQGQQAQPTYEQLQMGGMHGRVGGGMRFGLGMTSGCGAAAESGANMMTGFDGGVM
jgi:hypothetical protein